MTKKNRRRTKATDYSPNDLLLVRQTCLYIFSHLPGELVEQITVVGGLVPSLLIKDPPSPGEYHLGTADLDIGLRIGSQGVNQYERLTAVLGDLKFEPERTKDGKAAGVRWRLNRDDVPEVLIDILPAVLDRDREQLAQLDLPGIELSARTGFALLDRERVELSGECIVTGEHRDESLWVCGPGAYIVIKALTFVQRNLKKDAYDLYYVLRNYGAGVQDVFPHIAPLMSGSRDAQRALTILHDDFADPNGDGAIAVPLFLYGRADDELQADVAGFTNQLLASLGMAP
jgi:hypothetical protein